ncbi:ROK family transcriptional regulator [Actinocrispum sp. NPDC049592]|uniref:ROK family transcriptional regulator n=1 Tax=Actinocrispum sp. NPDC049592 TaxID=3154835 RepID=UPI0034399553
MAQAPTAEILRLVSTGAASSRTDLARLLGLARSTVSVRVQELLDAGLLAETGEGPSRGGRRPRVLRAAGGGGYVIGADLGAQHARVAAFDLSGERLHIDDYELDITTGPESSLATLAAIVSGIRDLLPGQQFLGLGLGLPGPVNFPGGRVEGASRMPGWHGYGVRDWLATRLEVPVAVDNDANVVALGEFHTRNRGPEHLVVVKAGTGVGCGVIANGVVHRGANGVSGDVSHVRVSAGGDIPCGCGNTGCLETIASGAALAQSVGLAHTADLVELANNADPTVTAAVRRAGGQLGEVLSTVVNFFNPHAVLLTGRLAAIEPFVAAVRGALYERCLPMATQNLEVSVASAGADAGSLGAGLLALHLVHSRKD